MALTYPKKYEDDINPETWNRDITDPANAKQQDLNGFLLHRMAHYKDSEYNGTALWYCMKEDFVGWTKETWALAKKVIVRDFRNFLRENGVFVPMDGGNIGNNIQEHVIDAKEEHEWTPQEIEHQKKLNSRGNPNNGQLQAAPQVPQAPSPQAPSVQAPSLQAPSHQQPPQEPPQQPPQQRPQQSLQQSLQQRPQQRPQQPLQEPPKQPPQQPLQESPRQPRQEIKHQLRAIKKSSSRGNSSNGQPQATPQVPQAAVSQPVPQAAVSQPVPQAPSYQQRPQQRLQEPQPIPLAIPTAAPQVVPIAAPPATPIAAPATPQQSQQPQQLHTHTPPEPAVTSVEQGPRQGPRYTCQGVPTCGITVSNPGEDLSQLINKLQPSIATREKEHPSQRVYTTSTDRHYRNQDQAPSHQQAPRQSPRQSPQQPLQQLPQQLLQEPLQQYPQQPPQKPPQKPPQRPRSANSIFNQQQQPSIPPQTFNKLQKIQCGGGFQDFCSSQGSYRGGYQRDPDRKFSWKVP